MVCQREIIGKKKKGGGGIVFLIILFLSTVGYFEYIGSLRIFANVLDIYSLEIYM